MRVVSIDEADKGSVERPSESEISRKKRRRNVGIFFETQCTCYDIARSQ